MYNKKNTKKSNKLLIYIDRRNIINANACNKKKHIKRQKYRTIFLSISFLSHSQLNEYNPSHLVFTKYVSKNYITQIYE